MPIDYKRLATELGRAAAERYRSPSDEMPDRFEHAVQTVLDGIVDVLAWNGGRISADLIVTLADARQALEHETTRRRDS